MNVSRPIHELRNLQLWLTQTAESSQELPAELEHLLWLEADHLLPPEESADLQQLISESPLLQHEMLAIRTACQQTAAAGPIPDAVGERLRQRVLRSGPLTQRPRLVARASGTQLAWVSRLSSSDAVSFQMARGSHDESTRIEDTLHLRSGQFQLAIQPDAGGLFLLTGTLLNVSPHATDRALTLALETSSGQLLQTAEFITGTAVIEDVSAGDYRLKLLADGQVADEFELCLETSEPDQPN